MMMRLGGPITEKYDSPEAWAALNKKAGFEAAFCPVEETAGKEEIAAYKKAAEKNGILISEVGAWCNPISPDPKQRSEALEYCKKRLYLADEIGAVCCVNIAGSRSGSRWDGPHPCNLDPDTFEMIVASVREIIDDVRPVRAFYTLETMPWVLPDSADSYLALMDAIGRERFAVHLDPVNIINSPGRYFRNPELLKDFFKKLGPHIRSCHAKDTLLEDTLTVHLKEVRPGLGKLDYTVYIREINKLSGDIPLMIEHLSEEEDIRQSALYIRGVADKLRPGN